VPPRNDAALTSASSKLLQDEHLRQAMGVAGAHRVREHFSAERIVKEPLELYRCVCMYAQVENARA
jgi:hypothetical protein